MRYLRRTLLVAVIAAVTVVGPLAGAPAGGAEPAPFTMTADPTHGIAGDLVEVTATSCVDPGTEARLVFVKAADPGAGLAAPVGTVTADAAGSFVTSITVPQQVHDPAHPQFGSIVTAGDYQIVAVPFPEGQSVPCVATFHVDRAVTLALSVVPATGPAGSTVQVIGSCFGPEARTVSVHAEIDGVAVPGSEVANVVSKGPSEVPTLIVWAADVVLPSDLVVGTVVSFVGSCTAVGYVPATFVVAATTSIPAAPPVEGAPARTG
jgi:hypothetical protein